VSLRRREDSGVRYGINWQDGVWLCDGLMRFLWVFGSSRHDQELVVFCYISVSEQYIKSLYILLRLIVATSESVGLPKRHFMLAN
jgi:hypothetical protein